MHEVAHGNNGHFELIQYLWTQLYTKHTQQIPFSDAAPGGIKLLNCFPDFLKGTEVTYVLLFVLWYCGCLS